MSGANAGERSRSRSNDSKMTHPSPETCRPLLHEALLFWKRSPHDGGANSYFIYNTDGSDVGTVGSDLIAIVKLQSGAARVASNVELALWPDLVRNWEEFSHFAQ